MIEMGLNQLCKPKVFVTEIDKKKVFLQSKCYRPITSPRRRGELLNLDEFYYERITKSSVDTFVLRKKSHFPLEIPFSHARNCLDVIVDLYLAQ